MARFLHAAMLASLVLAGMALASPAPALDAEEITERTMRNLHPARDTSFEMAVFECPQGTGSCALPQGENLTELTVYVADYKQDESEPPKTVVRMRSPKAVRNRIILYESNRIWMYFPNTRSAIRIPAEQSLLGDVDVGALLNVDYRFNHSKEIIGQDEQAWDMEFVGPDRTRTVMRISKSGFVPMSAEYFAPSGRKVRSAAFLDYRLRGGRNRPHRIDFVSRIADRNRGGLTSLVILEESGKRLPAIVLNPRQLPNFHKRVR